MICSSFDLRASHWSVKFNYFSQIGTKYAKNTAIKIDWRVAVQLWVLDILKKFFFTILILWTVSAIFILLNIWSFAFSKNIFYFFKDFFIKNELVNNKIWYWKKIIINKIMKINIFQYLKQGTSLNRKNITSNQSL